MAPETLTAEVLYRVGGLDACARSAGTRVACVKPHGALYNAGVALGPFSGGLDRLSA